MDEVIGLAVLVVVAALTGTWIALRAAESRRQPAAIGPPSGDTAAAREYYRVAQHAVRLMEALLRDDMTRVVIPEADRAEMQRLVDRFYEL